MISDCTATTLQFVRRVVSETRLSRDDVDRIDELRALEELKCAIEGRQAALTAAFDASQRAAARRAGVPAERQGRGIPFPQEPQASHDPHDRSVGACHVVEPCRVMARGAAGHLRARERWQAGTG